MSNEFQVSSFQFQAQQVREAAVFCLEHGAKLFAGWSGDKLFRYLAFLWLTNCLFIERAPGNEIIGVLSAWPDVADEILQRERNGEFHFNWRQPRVIEDSDAFMLADIVVSKSAIENRQSKIILTRLVAQATAQWPDWKLRRVFTYRRGRLVEITQPTAKLERFCAHVVPQNS